MKRKTVILIGALALTLAGCSGEVAVDSTAETSEITANTEVSTEVSTKVSTKVQEEALMEQDDNKEEQDNAVLSEEKREIIEKCLSDGSFSDSILLEEMTSYLDEKGIRYEGYYNDVRVDLTLEDGTPFIFLEVESDEGETIGYELIMQGEYFNGEFFQEHFYHAYDVIIDQYYYSSLSDEIITEEELSQLNSVMCSIARNELFAKYGRTFEDSFLAQVFSQKSWYEPKYTAAEFDAVSQDFLTDIEKENLKLILEYEGQFKSKSSGNAKAVKAVVPGSWIDLDADGTKERITYRTDEAGDADFASKITISVNDIQVEHDGVNTYGACCVASMDGKHYYIIVGDYGESADYVSTFYEYRDGEIRIAGAMSAHPMSLEINPENIVAPEETDHFQCQPVRYRYELRNGVFEKQEDDYYDYRQNVIVANQDIFLYETKNVSTSSVTIAKGDEVQVMGGDMKSWVLLKKVSTGEEGWLKVEGMNCILSDGSEVSSYDLFEGIYMYG